MSPYAADLIRRGDETGISLAVARDAGIYPLDYVLTPCPVERELSEGDRVSVGELELVCLETPGPTRPSRWRRIGMLHDKVRLSGPGVGESSR